MCVHCVCMHEWFGLLPPTQAPHVMDKGIEHLIFLKIRQNIDRIKFHYVHRLARAQF